MNKIKQSFKQTFLGIKELLPILIGVLLLISLINNSDYIKNILSSLENNFLSVFIADIIASISAGNAINSYIIAKSMGELESNTKIISTFLIAWVTVGIIQLPAEFYFFGKRFTITRNIIAFSFAILSGYIIYFLMSLECLNFIPN